MSEYLMRAEKVYKRYVKVIDDIVFPLVLLLWPLVKVTQGVDVSDSTYSLGNYLFAGRLDGMWVISTFLSNSFGALIVRLPGGDTLVGANVYFGLIVSGIALVTYYALRHEFTAPVMFISEFLALSFCWIPTGIMYNYLTYLLFTIGAILIYFAVKKDNKGLYCIAGLVLGLNVFVRIPNLTEMALIISVWVGTYISKKQIIRASLLREEILKNTGMCVLGYAIGVAVPLIIIIAIYGIDGIEEMIVGLSAISSGDDTYTIFSMLSATFSAYVRSAKWFLIILAIIFAGTLMMAAVNSHKLLKNIGKVVYLFIVLVMLRFFWGRGMFTLKYYEDYTSMFEWGMVALYMAWISAIVVLCIKKYNVLMKTYAIICIVILVITPLGSNNFTCQNLNNMFLVVPFTLFTIGGWLYRGVHRFRLEGVLYGCNFPWMSMCIVILIVTLIQTSLFHVNFVFRDGMDGTPRDARIQSAATASINGICTSEEKASNLIGLCEYVQGIEDKEEGSLEAIYWGDCPGLAYILRVPAAISTTWPDLDSYPIESWDNELTNLSSSDGIVIWRKLESPSGNNGEIKQDILLDYIATKKLSNVYENNEYIVYR